MSAQSPTSFDASDDANLRRRILRGEREAAEEVFRRHFEPLYEFVHYRVGADRALVEDLVQDTFVVAFESLPRFDGRSSLHTWLCGIAKNKLRAHRRRRRPMAMSDVLAESEQEIDAILAAVDREALPEWVLERQETRDLVGATLTTLPPDYRRALIDKYIEGRTTAEIAAANGKGVKAAESMLVRARTAFARVFSLLARKRGGLA